jgi:8-oxo-dGTP pyrophosphatase MutT (NUDIX family)
MAQPRIAAGALFHDTAGRVPLLRPTYKDFWDLPGGYVEPGESPYAACAGLKTGSQVGFASAAARRSRYRFSGWLVANRAAAR